MKAPVYNSKGKEERKIDLPESVFGLSWNSDLVHQVVTSILANKRNPIAHTKGRSEVRGGGRKPWRQKGTGRARHGSNRSPIWKGGGVTFGPTKERDFSKKINKKMKDKALFYVLSKKARDGEILFVDNLDIKEPKTKEMKEVLANLSKNKGFETLLSKKNNSALVAFGVKNVTAEKSFNNFSNILTTETRNLNPAQILNKKYLVIINPKESLEFLSSKAEK